MIGAKENQNHIPNSVYDPVNSVLYSVSQQVKFCVNNMVNKKVLYILLSVLETVLVMGNNSVTLMQEPSILF